MLLFVQVSFSNLKHILMNYLGPGNSQVSSNIIRTVYSHYRILHLSSSICAGFEDIKRRCLKDPDSSEELMDIVAYVENARTFGMMDLMKRIEVTLDSCSSALATVCEI